MLFRATFLALMLASPAIADGYAVGDTFDDPLQIAREAVGGYNLPDEGRPRLEVDISTDFFGQVTILVAETGFADDSVNGQRDQYVLTQQDGVWTLVFTRTEFRCQRGANTVTWQSDLCP